MISDKFYFYLLPSFSSDKPHYPYELPKGWEWTTVGEISQSILYGVSESAKSHGAYKLLRITDIQNNFVNWETVPFTDYDESKAESYLLKDGDILFARTGATVGKSYLVNSLQENAIYASYLIRVQTYNQVLPEFVKYFFESGYYWSQILCNSVGIGQPNVNGTILANLMLLIPPITEQKRIVKELTKWLSIIDKIDRGKENLQDAIKHAKSKILDLAIHGKLVPQDPNDEPATDLLKRINPKAEIISDNGHYQKLPKGWCLVKGKHIFNPMKSCKPIGETFKYIDIDAIDNKRQIISNVKILKVANAPSRASRFTQKGDVVFSLVRPYLRNIAIVSENDCIASTGFYVCHPTEVLLPKYCYHLMISDYIINGLNEFMKGDNSPSINKGDIDNWLFPIPPLAEQKRIVSKIEEIFSQFDAIETAL